MSKYSKSSPPPYAEFTGLDKTKDADVHIQIHLEPALSEFYYPGENVRGNVLITIKKTIRCHGLYVKAKGTGSITSWRDVSKVDEDFFETEKYFDLMCSELKRDAWLLEPPHDQVYPWRFNFPFQFELPDEIPSSYQGDYAKVNYTIKAVIIRAWNKDNNICTLPFTVKAGGVSSMVAQRLKVPPRYSGYTPDLIMAEAWLDQNEYTPGSTILFSAKVQNLSGRCVTNLVIRLIQNITTKSRIHKSVKVVTSIWEEKTGPISDTETREWINFPIVIPAKIPPTGSPFKCNYMVKLIITDPGNFVDNEVAQLPIFIREKETY